MVEAVVSLLITICVIALVFYLIVWVLGRIGVELPAKAIQILYVIFALIVILMLYRLLMGSGFDLPRLI